MNYKCSSIAATYENEELKVSPRGVPIVNVKSVHNNSLIAGT